VFSNIVDTVAVVNVKNLDARPIASENIAFVGNPYKANPQQQNCQRQSVFQHIGLQKPGIQVELFNQVHIHERAPQAKNGPSVAFPKYWRHRNLNPRGGDSAYQRFQIDRGDQLYKDLENMFTCGLGNNLNQLHVRARDLQWRQFNVRSRKIAKIWCLENAYLYGKYAEKREEFRLNALVNTCRPLSDLLGPDLSTLMPGWQLAINFVY